MVSSWYKQCLNMNEMGKRHLDSKEGESMLELIGAVVVIWAVIYFLGRMAP